MNSKRYFTRSWLFYKNHLKPRKSQNRSGKIWTKNTNAPSPSLADYIHRCQTPFITVRKSFYIIINNNNNSLKKTNKNKTKQNKKNNNDRSKKRKPLDLAKPHRQRPSKTRTPSLPERQIHNFQIWKKKWK